MTRKVRFVHRSVQIQSAELEIKYTAPPDAVYAKLQSERSVLHAVQWIIIGGSAFTAFNTSLSYWTLHLPGPTCVHVMNALFPSDWGVLLQTYLPAYLLSGSLEFRCSISVIKATYEIHVGIFRSSKSLRPVMLISVLWHLNWWQPQADDVWTLSCNDMNTLPHKQK
jgi:hypothetical protein